MSTVRLCSFCNAALPAAAKFCPGCGRGVPLGNEPQSAMTNLGTVEAGSSLLTVADDGPAPPRPIDNGQFVPGRVLADRYRIVGLLGKGGMGEVYRADDLKLHQVVALKFLPAALADDALRLDRLRNEVRTARQISHPNVCRVYDLGEIDGQAYLSMEYVDGEDLASLLRRIGRLPRDKAIDIARQVCAGLAAAHEKGIVHRDLKPMNIMIDGRGKVRITDFGLAALLDDEHSIQRGGTPAYMAPEQLKGKKSTIGTDVFSLGLVLYEAFTGKRAYEARSVNDLIRLHAETTPTSPTRLVDDLDPAVERVIMRCLEREPDARPQSALTIAAALPGGDPLAAALLAGETPSPELVAAAAHKEGMPPIVCLACLLTVLIGLLAFPFLSDQVKLHALCSLEKSPAVLIDRARQIVRELGYQDLSVADTAYGWNVNEDILVRIETLDLLPTRWSVLNTDGPAAMEFWYRQAIRPLVPSGEAGVVTAADPPLEPGSLALRLDPHGRLIYLEVVPTEPSMPQFVRKAAPWARVLQLAEFGVVLPDSTEPSAEVTANSEENGPASQPADALPTTSISETIVQDDDYVEPPVRATRLAPEPSERLPPTFADERVAWCGRHPRDPDILLRIEAAAFQGRPVYFETIIESGETSAIRPDSAQGWLQRGAQLLNGILLVGCLAAGAMMARRNLELGRGDRRGAIRVAGFVAAALIAAWGVQADHVADARQQFGLFSRAAGRALFVGGMCWLLYMALEPHVRRRWPDMLIAWSRLLVGRFRDPLLGRDILIGALFGILGMVFTALRHFGPAMIGWPPPRPTGIEPLTLLGLRYDAAQLLNVMTMACLQPMVGIVLLITLLVLIREKFTTMLAFHLLITGALTVLTLQTGGNPIIDLTYHGVLAAALIFVLMRFGLFAVMVALFFMQLFNTYPITSNFDAWYAESAAFAIFVAGAVAIYGYVTALAGRRLLSPAA
ncbi:MAG: protein kinase domain-containing protein [Phycisphaerae bacterium]